MIKNKENDEEIKRMMSELVGDITLERERLGLSQSKLAELAGVKQSAVSRMESLGALPQLDTILRVIQPLGLRLTVKQKNHNRRDFMNIKNDNIKKIEVATVSCRLNVTSSNDDEFHVVTDREDEFTQEKTDDTIVIRQKKRSGIKWLLQWIPIDIKITVPRSFSGEVVLNNQNGRTRLYSINLGAINIKNGNGMLRFEDINAGDIILHDSSGRIELQGASIKSLDAHSGNGRIQLIDVKCDEKLKCKTSNGRVILKNCTAKKFDFTSSNGAILLSGCDADDIKCATSNGRIVASLLSNEDEYAMDLSTSLGGIWVGTQKYTGRYIVKNNGKKLDANTSNGSIRFSFADTPDLIAEITDDDDSDFFEAEADLFENKDDKNDNDA